MVPIRPQMVHTLNPAYDTQYSKNVSTPLTYLTYVSWICSLILRI